MADLAALKAAVDETEAAKEVLIGIRRENYAQMNRTDFKAYNEESRDLQVQLQADVDDATEAFQAELKVIRADAVDNAINVAVGTINESNTLESS